MSRCILLALLFLVPCSALAQSTTPVDSVFVQAQRLVAGGQADSGRALVEKQLAATTPGTSAYAEALYWRGVLSATAADAERDYRRIIVEYPISPRMDDALLRIAQLEMARGERQQALDHLARLVRERPDSPARARASYWMARVLFEEGDLPRGCARLTDAGHRVAANNVELRNQIDFYQQRCLGVDTTGTAVAAVPAPDTATTPTPARAPAPAPTRARTPPASDTARTGGEQRAAAPRAAERTTPPSAVPATSARGATQFTVQVGAYATRVTANAKRKALTAAGFDARVIGAGKLYRVRVGRYPSRAAALDIARQLVTRKLAPDAFVTEAEGRTR